MKIYISSKKLLWGCIAILTMMALYILNKLWVDDYSNLVRWSREISVLIIVLLTTQLLFLTRIIPKKRMIIYAVIIFLYIFHFSHTILKGMDYDFGTNIRNSVFFRQSIPSVITGTHLEITGSIGIFIGIVIFYMFYKLQKIGREKLYIENRNIVLAYVFIISGFVADLAYSLSTIIALFMGGYASVQETSSNTFYGIRIISYLLLAGVLIMIQDKRASTQKKHLILVIFILYKVIMMISGLRAYGLINILLILYVYYRREYQFKLRLKHILLALVILQVGGGFIVGIREARTVGMNVSTVVSYMFDIRSNILLNMMSEFGITQNISAIIVSQLDGIAAGGKQLLYSILLVVPGISKIAPNLDYSNAFLEDVLNIHNYGGTYIGDLLFDFGTSGLFLSSIILGIFFAFLYEWYERNIEEGHTLNVAIAAPIMVDFIFCVRSSMAKMPRMISWYLAIAYFIIIITNSYAKHGKASNNG